MPAGDRSDASAIVLAAAVREAGALALKTFRSPVRAMDQGQVVAGLRGRHRGRCAAARDGSRGAFPAYGWLSEETEDDPQRLHADAVWIVDPIDGTRAYLDGREDWVVSVALAAAGRPRLAALYAPVTDEFFLAVAGEGATRNGVPIAGPARDRASTARSCSGPSASSAGSPSCIPSVVPLPRIGSLALRLARVAHGEVDIAVVSGNSHDWDLAAADLLVHEAGGALTDLDGERLVYNRPKPVHGLLVAAEPVAPCARRLHLMRERRAQFA